MRQKTFQFAVDSALLGELGEKLVSTVHVALAELIKNAYDADATQVSVSIEPQQKGAPRILVHDDGIGMSQDEVRLYWMKIGTSNKVAQPVTPKYGRLKTGSKGIGRFACRRLGLSLNLQTCGLLVAGRSKGMYQTTTVQFDWARFEPGTDVESINCIGETGTSSSGRTGTTLEISGGPLDEWQSRGFDYLQRQLAVLASNTGTSRRNFETDPGFNVLLTAPGLSAKPIDLRSAVIDATWGTLEARVERDGKAVLSLNAKGLPGTRKFTSKQRFPHIQGAALRLGILPTSKEDARKPELLASYVLSDLINEWGGIHVRFNGFRMFPYGDLRDDWLQIDSDRGRRVGKPENELFDFAASLDRVDASRSLLNMLGMRNYLGQVELTSRIVGLTPRIDRQGFIENEIFNEVRRFTRFAVDWANIHRDHYIRLREVEDAEKARDAIRPILNLEGPKENLVPKAAAFLRGEIKRIVKRLPAGQQKETEQTLIRTVRAIETSSSESHLQLRHLRLIASASTLTLLFAHEVRTVIGSLGASAARLNQLGKRIPGHTKELSELAQQLKDTKERFDALVGMTGIVGAFRKTDDLVSLHLRTSIERAVNCFHLILQNYAIPVEVSAVSPEIVVGPMIEGELYAVLLNLLSNAVKSVIAAGDAARRIKFEAIHSEGSTVMRVWDTGVGLSPAFFDEVFTPFIADPSGQLYDKLEERLNPEDTAIFGSGTGLGLSIARDVARSRGGDIRFMEVSLPWKACVEVVFR